MCLGSICKTPTTKLVPRELINDEDILNNWATDISTFQSSKMCGMPKEWQLHSIFLSFSGFQIVQAGLELTLNSSSLQPVLSTSWGYRLQTPSYSFYFLSWGILALEPSHHATRHLKQSREKHPEKKAMDPANSCPENRCSGHQPLQR